MQHQSIWALSTPSPRWSRVAGSGNCVIRYGPNELEECGQSELSLRLRQCLHCIF